MQSLFRPEAVAHATGRLDGAVLVPAPLATWGVIAIVVAVLGFGVWFAATATYTRHESVPGWLSPQGGVARAVASQPGTVTTLEVVEGDIVEAGTPLARIVNADRPGSHVVGAPIGGRVEALARVGQSMQHGSTVAVLAAGDDLIAELLVPPHTAGLVATGQTLPLKYEVLPRGVQHGTVTHVSRTPLAPDEISHPGLPVTGPVFHVRVRIPGQRIAVGEASVQLRAGMLLNAEIAGPRQTILQSLFGPNAERP